MRLPRWRKYTREQILNFAKQSISYIDFWKKLGYKCGDTIDVIQKCLDYYNIDIDFKNNQEKMFEEEYIGKQYGRLTILKKDTEKSIKNRITWVVVQCSCEKHTIFSVSLNHLKTGTTKSCGCLYRQFWHDQGIKNREDLTGYKTGKLTVINYNDEESQKHNRVYWNVKCECGRECAVSAMALKRGQFSCGCEKSSGEYKLNIVLNDLNIPYEKECQFPDLMGNSKPLKFDYYLPTYNAVIECQGIQHYQPVEIFGGEQQFKIQKKYDSLKREYCKNNNIRLIEISYKDYEKIDNMYIQRILKENGDNIE